MKAKAENSNKNRFKPRKITTQRKSSSRRMNPSIITTGDSDCWVGVGAERLSVGW